MVRLASTEIDFNGTIVNVSTPDTTYLQGILPLIGDNIYAYQDKETNAIIKKYVDDVFSSTTPVELNLNINSSIILLTAHRFQKDRALIFWKNISNISITPPFQSDWGFGDLALQEERDEVMLQKQYDVKRFTDNLPLVVFEIYLYPDGRFQFGFVNKEMETFFPGFNKEAINADNSLLFVRVHQDDKQKLLDSIKDVFKLKVWNIEYRILEQGEVRWVKGFGRPEVGNNSERITVCTYLEDVTEKKHLEQKLKLVDYSFRNAATPILLLLEDATFFDFNESMPQLLGYDYEEFKQLTIPDIDTSFDKASCTERWIEFRKIKKATFPNRLKKKDGSFVDVEIRSNLIIYEGKEINYSFIIDVTEKNKLEKNFKLTDFIFRNTASAITLIREDGSFYDFNDAALYFFGYSKEEYALLSVQKTNADIDDQRWLAHWNELRKNKNLVFNTQIKRKDGRILEVEVNANLIKFEDLELNFSIATDITEKKKLTEELRLIDYSFRNVSSPMFFINPDGSFLDFNNATAKLLGYTIEEFKHLTVFDINPSFKSKEDWDSRWNEIMLQEKITSYSKLIRKDGKQIDVEIKTNMIKNGDNLINCGFYRDITEKKRLEDQLKLVDYTFRSATTAINLALKDGSFYDFNDAACNMLGYSRNEYAQLKIEDVDPRYKTVNWSDRWEELKSKKEGITVYGKKIRKDGTMLDVESRIKFIQFGELELICGFINDITEKKKKDEQLKLVDFTFRNTKLPMYFLNEDGSVYDFNEEAARQLGFTPDEFKHTTVFDLSLWHTPQTWAVRWKEIRAENNIRRNTKLIKKDKTIIEIEVSCHIIKYYDKELCFISFLDITEKNKLDEKLNLVDFAFRNASIPMYFIAKDGSMYDFNDEACKVLGYSPEEFKKLTVFEISNRHTKESWKKRWEEFREDSVFPNITKLRRKDQSIIDAEMRTKIINYRDFELSVTSFIDITEKNKLDEQLKLVDFSFGNVDTAIVFSKENGSLHSYNKAFRDLYGYTDDEMKKLTMFDFGTGFTKESWQDYWEKLKREQSFSFVTKRKRKDGTPIDVEINANFIKLGDLEVNCAFVYDITELKKAEQALKISNERYEYATLATSDVIWETDLINDTLYLGNNFTTVFGLETTGIEYGPNNIWRNNLHPNDLSITLQNEQYAIVGKSDKWVSEYRLKKGNGEYAIVLDRGFVVKNSNGKAVRLIGAMQDITEKKKIEDELQLVNFSFKHAVTPIMYIREDASLYNFNDAFVEMMGYDRSELLGMKVFDLDPDFSPNIWPPHWNELKTKGKLSFITKKKKKDGSIIDVEVNANLINYGSIELNCAFVTDITEKKQIEQQIKRSNQRYEFATLATSDVVWETDIIANTLYLSNNFTNIYGHPIKEVEELANNVWTHNVHPDDIKRVLDTEKKVITENGDKWVEEYRFRKADGNYAIVLDRGFTIKDEYGNITGMIGSMQDITERKKIEEELKRSYLRYEYATLATSDVVWETDLINGTLYLSNNFTTIYGYPLNGLQSIENSVWRQNVHPDDLQLIQDSEKKVIDEIGDKWEGEYRFRRADGSYAFVLDRSFVVKDEHGTITGVIGSMQDITEKKKIEKELTRSNTRFEYATLATSDVIWESDFIENTYYSSKSFTELFGHKSGIYQNIDDNEWIKNVHPDDLKKVLKKSSDSVANGAIAWRNEYRFRKANGEYADILDRVFVVRDQYGKPLKLIGALHDVTERKQREERLQLIETVITNTTDAIIIRDAKRLSSGGLPVLYTNNAFSQMTGYTYEEVKGRTLKVLNGPLTSRDERDLLRNAINNFVPGKIEMIQYKKDGTPYWASISVFPVANDLGEFTHWVSIQRDITTGKKAQEEREHLLNELIINNKELKQFGYITTHNLRAPLTNLIAICRLLNNTTIEDARTKRLIEGFQQSTLQLNDTLNDLIEILIIKEKRNLPTIELGFQEMLTRVMDSISSNLSSVEATINSDFSEVPNVQFSNVYLESIFLNLLTNAIKYAHPERKPIINVLTKRNENGTIKLTFSDNGIGMNMERVKDRIFGLYQRFHSNSDSKGIGLYLIHSQITALGGSIEVESEENVGTTFTITFK